MGRGSTKLWIIRRLQPGTSILVKIRLGRPLWSSCTPAHSDIRHDNEVAPLALMLSREIAFGSLQKFADGRVAIAQADPETLRDGRWSEVD
jgi:hypothetical protein